jgi:adenylate cyclase
MKTVRGKLLFIVALCLVPLLVATLLFSVAMEREERDDAGARLASARLAFATELADDAADLETAGRIFTSDPGAVAAVARGDRAEIHARLTQFTQVYPGVRVIATDEAGRVLASSADAGAGGSLGGDALVQAALQGRTARGVAELRLPGEGQAALVYASARPIDRAGKREGALVAAVKLDALFLEGLRKKADVAFALVQGEGTLAAQSSGGPDRWFVVGRAGPPTPKQLEVLAEREDHDGRVFAIQGFAVDALRGGPGAPVVTVIAARDMTELAHDHRRFLLYRLAALFAVAACAVGVALFLASGMSRSVGALVEVLPGIAERRYLPAQVVPTGDELQRLAETYNGMIARLKEGDLWRRALGKYLSRAALEGVMKGELKLGGTVVTSTILFSDIRGFTTLAERMEPMQVLAVLNRYFTEMVFAVIRNDGIVDKFIGDAIMAVWGPPQPSANDALNAVRAALEMRDRLARLNLDFAAQGMPVIRTGIGIHTGPVVAGNMGAEGTEGEAGKEGQAGKMEYTVIGDAVNVASRLESLTKELQEDVVLSEDTVAAVGDRVRVEPLKSVVVKGRTRPVLVYRLLGLSGAPGA